MKKEAKRTAWFNPETKPAYLGVYEIVNPINGDVVYAFWDGSQWGPYTHAEDLALVAYRRSVDCTRAYQKKTWRGLAVKP